MSDLFDNFIFDLQRFYTGTTNYTQIKGSSSEAGAGDYCWGASGALIELENTTPYSTSAIVQVN